MVGIRSFFSYTPQKHINDYVSCKRLKYTRSSVHLQVSYWLDKNKILQRFYFGV
jgi:hypothetical protein